MIISDKYKIIYYSVPKIAHSSLMEMMHVLNTGQNFPHQKKNIYGVYFSRNFEKYTLNSEQKKYFKFCVVRDPVKRFISSYNHRILDEKRHYKNNSDHKKDHYLYKKVKFKERPTVRDVLNNLSNYNKNIDIEWHLRPQHKFLGKNASFYDKVYDISEINTHLISDLEGITGKKIRLSKENKGKVKSNIDLPVDDLKKIKSVYKYDYEIYGDFFQR